DPIVTIDAVTSPTATNTQTITGTYTETNIYTITINGINATFGAGTYSYLLSLNEGPNTITVTATDLSGRTGTETSSIVLDTVKPSTSDDYGAKDGNWQNADQTITLTPNDAGPSSGIASTKYCTDTDNTCNPATGTAYTVAVTISTVGTSYFRYQSIDVAGNVQTIVSRTVMIDKTNPSTIDDYGAKNGNWQNADQTITLTPNDAGPSSGIASTKYCTDAIDCTPDTDGTSKTISTEGTTYFRYQSIDVAGNVQTIVSRTVMIDKTAPSITSVTPSSIITVGQTKSISANVVDSASGNKNDGVNLVYTYPNGTIVTKAMTNVTNIYSATIPSQSSSKTITYYITAQDNAGNTETDSTTYSLSINDLSLDLASSWNLVSVPKTLTTPNVETLLPGSIIWQYSSGNWTNPLTIEPGIGYWVDNYNPSLGLNYASTSCGGNCIPTGDTDITSLITGWNLIGLTTTNSTKKVSDVFKSQITGQWVSGLYYVISYNKSTDQFVFMNADNSMNPGEGYWVYKT
ncbi:MAG: Ig-like domain repeat protein, partial [archaeon]|nr:Ig-like domain repeat protein [archaeon]